MKHDIVTAVIYYYTTTEFHYAKRDPRLSACMEIEVLALRSVIFIRKISKVLKFQLKCLLTFFPILNTSIRCVTNLCQNFTLRWKSVIADLCLVRPQVFPFDKNFAKRQNIKDAVVLGWGRQILEKLSQTMGIIAATVNACQRYMENDTRGKFNSSWLFFGPMLTHEF